MRRSAITETQVFEAADRLTAQGREVTPNALLSEIGSGSYTTIYKHLAAWQSTRTTSPLNSSLETPPLVQTAFQSAWRAAVAEATREVSTVREKALNEVKSIQKQFDEALSTIEKLEDEQEKSANLVEELKNRLAELESAVHRIDSEKAALQATNEQIQLQLKATASDLSRRQEEFEKTQKERDAAIAEASEMRGEIRSLKEQARDLISRFEEDKGRQE